MTTGVSSCTRCAYCDAEGAEERDHVLSKCLYPPSKAGSTVQRITVPACSSCNRGWSDDEAHFRNVMLLAGDSNAPVRELWPKAERSFYKIDGLRRVIDIYRAIEPVRVSGIHRWMIYPARDERVLRVVRKVVRGLAYYHHLGPITSDERVTTDILRYPIPVQLLESETLHHREPDIFEYWYQNFDDGDSSSVWLLRFYEKRVFVAAIAAPSA